jgi:O-antigen/teichoic acid export membrane protein
MYGVALIFSKIFILALIPLYANYLTRSDYSNLIILQTIFGFLTFFLHLVPAVIFYYYRSLNEDFRKSIFTTWFYFQLGMSLVLILLLYSFSPLFSSLFLESTLSDEKLVYCLLLVGIQLIPFGVNNTVHNYFLIDRQAKKVLKLMVLETFIVCSFIAFSVLYLKSDLIGILLSQIFGRLIVSLFYIPTISLFLSVKLFSVKLLKRFLHVTWPMFVIDIFSWFIVGLDKIIGSIQLKDPSELVLLAIALQLMMPVNLITQIIDKTLSPFLHSIQQNLKLEEIYQRILDLSVYFSVIMVLMLTAVSPFLFQLFKDKNLMPIIYVLPLIGFANVLSIFVNQVTVNFNMNLKNVYVLYATIAGGLVGAFINYFFMPSGGFVISGYAQIVAFLTIALLLYIFGKKVAHLNVNLKNSAILLIPFSMLVIFLNYENNNIIHGQRFNLLIASFCCIILTSIIFIGRNKWFFPFLKSFFTRKDLDT